MKPNVFCVYCGPDTAKKTTPGANDPRQGGVDTLMKGPMLLSSVITEAGSDEGCEETAKLLAVASDSFFRRPSLKDLALQKIGEFMNSRIMLLRGPQGRQGYDVALLMNIRNRVRWITCGGSRIFHFQSGRLAHASRPGASAAMGKNPIFHLTLEPAVELGTADNAFLLCSPVLAELLTAEQLEQALAAASTPEQWMDAILERAGQERQFCACTLMLPGRKTRFPLWIPAVLAALAAAAYLILR